MDCEQSISLSITSTLKASRASGVILNNFYRIIFALQFNVELSELEDANQCPSFSLSVNIMIAISSTVNVVDVRNEKMKKKKTVG